MSNFEGYKSRLTSTRFATTITPAMRTGDFSSILRRVYSGGPELAHRTRFPNITQSYFPGNQIPAKPSQHGIHSAPEVVSQCRICPQRPDCLSAIINMARSLRSTKIRFTERIDFNESSKSQWFGRYSWNDESTCRHRSAD